MAAQLMGAHMPTSKGLGQAILNGKSIGCTAIQVFTSSPQQWKSKEITSDMVTKFQSACNEANINNVISHDSYLINLCAPDDELRRKSIDALKNEMRRCGQLGIHFVVSHMGAHLGQGEEAGLNKIVQATLEILADSPSEVNLLMETTAGQGSALNYKFEHLAYIFEQCKHPSRLGVCLDTCHIFVAGYDVRVESCYEKSFKAFEQIIGLEKLKVIHCNDSKKPLGSRVDRHEHIGLGLIGETAFKLLVNDSRFDRIPIILETPEAETKHAENLARLWSYQRAKAHA